MTTLHHLNTTELQLGDIVHNYGMRILLDRPAGKRPHGDRTVFWWVGKVLNPDEATASGLIPRSWLYHHSEHWVPGEGWRVDTNDPRWNVQGNHLATWSVERSDDETTDALGNPLPYGRCDTCGSPCGPDGCFRDDTHEIALTGEEASA